MLPFVDLALFVLCVEASSGPARGRWLAAGPHVMFRLYETIDHRYFRGDMDALEQMDFAGTFPSVPRLPLVSGADGPQVDPSTLDEIRDRDLDVIVSLAPGEPPSGLAASARYGVWTLSTTSDEAGAPPHFWEMYRGDL